MEKSKSTLKFIFDAELRAAKATYMMQNYDKAFAHLERAHILGQQFFAPHWLTHWWMLKVGIKRRDSREIIGQIVRLFAVIPGFLFGWLPKGNTGGADVSATKPMTIPKDLATLLADYDVWRDVRRRMAIWAVLVLAAILLFKL